MSEQTLIEQAWENRATLDVRSEMDYAGPIKSAVERVIEALDAGELRVAERLGGQWHVNQWVKKAVLLSFRLSDSQVMAFGDDFRHTVADPPWSPPVRYFDKVATKFATWDEARFTAAGIRVVPPAVARRGSFVGRNVILMPSFVNIGAYVDEGTMVDTWATVGSCAQIGKNVHLSGGVGIGGVLEPLQANPTIIEDNCFIGARSEVVEGVTVEENSVLGMGVFISQSTKIFNRETGEISYGRVPAGSVVVAGSLPSRECNLYCAVIVKQVDARTRAKTAINDLLRE